MTQSRRKFTAEQKAAIVRRHLNGKESISSIAEELSIQPTQIHQWVATALDQVERAFEKTAKSEKASKLAEAKINQLKEQRIKKLEEKLIHKNEVIAELMEETDGGERQGKKSQWGPLEGVSVTHDIRDKIVDYMKYWTERSDIPCKVLLKWAPSSQTASTTHGSNAMERPTNTTARSRAIGGSKIGRRRPY